MSGGLVDRTGKLVDISGGLEYRSRRLEGRLK